MSRSFTDALRLLKMGRAMNLLMNTPMKVSEIAAAVGYDSVDHFSRTFRRVYGLPPRQYKHEVFANAKSSALTADGSDAAGFNTFPARYKAALPVEKLATEVL